MSLDLSLLKTKSLWIWLVLSSAIIAISYRHLLNVEEWKDWTPFGFIILGSMIISIFAAIKEKADDDNSDFSNSDILMVLIAMIAIAFALAFHGQKADFLIVSLAGIIGLSVPLVLAISSKVNLGSRLDSGEIRKAIVISLTIVYIILLVVSFNSPSILGPKDNKTSAAFSSVSLHEKLTEKNSVEREHIFTFNLTGTNGGFEATNVSGFTFKFTPLIINGSSGKISLGGNSTAGNVDVIPESALASFTNNFLYVFVVIILFYFGSRAWENNKTDDKVKDYLKNLMNPTKDGSPTPLKAEEIVSLRYALGDIGDREYRRMMTNMMGITGGIRILGVDFPKLNTDTEVKINVLNANKKYNVTVEKISIEGKDDKTDIVDPKSKDDFEKQDRKVLAGGSKVILITTTGAARDKVYHVRVATDVQGDIDEGDYGIDSSGKTWGRLG